MHRLSTFLIPLLILLSVLGCSRNEKIVAEFGTGEKITLREFQQYINRLPAYVRGVITEKNLEIYLNRMIDDKITCIIANQKGYDKDPEFLDFQQRSEMGVASKVMLENIINRKVVPESMIRDFFHRSGKELTVRSIFFKNSAKDMDAIRDARKKAERVLKEIKGGLSFTSAARMYSDDSQTAFSGGLQVHVKYTNPEDPFQKAAFSLKEGVLSQVITDDNGFYIIRVERIEPVKQRSYEEMRSSIVKRLNNIYKTEIDQLTSEFLKSLRKEYQFTYNKAVTDSLAAISRLTNRIPADSLKALIKELDDQPVFTATDTVIYPKHLWDILDGKIYQDKNRIKMDIEKKLLLHYMYKEAVKCKYDRHPDVISEVRKVREESLKEMIIQKEVYDFIQPTEKDVRHWYDQHAMEKYGGKATVDVQEIQVSDKELAIELARRAKKGDDFIKLVQKYSEKKLKKNKNGRLRLTKQSMGRIGKTAFQLSVGEIAGPIEYANRYSIIKLIKHNPVEIIIPYDEYKENIRQDMIADVKKEKLEEWLDTHRKTIGIMIHKDLLKLALTDQKTLEE